MSQPEILRKVVAALATLGIDYMMTGSVVSSAQGEPRSTHDIDIVVTLQPEAIAGLVAAFPPPDYSLSEAAIRDALKARSMFNLLSLDDGDKVDFWLLTDEPFDRSRFARKRVETVLGLSLNVSSPEDTILVKLRWGRLAGGSEKQHTDALRVYEVQAGLLDQAYLDHWAGQLGVEEDLRRLRAQARPIEDEPPR